VVAVAAVPPTVLGLCVHLAVGLGAESAPTPCRELDINDDLAHMARQIVAATPGIGRNSLAKELSISTYRARG
jgi:hypothetical protein